MTEAERHGWNKAAVRMAADVANEKNVIVKLERDGSITVSPLQAEAVDEMRSFIASKTDAEIY